MNFWSFHIFQNYNSNRIKNSKNETKMHKGNFTEIIEIEIEIEIEIAHKHQKCKSNILSI